MVVLLERTKRAAVRWGCGVAGPLLASACGISPGVAPLSGDDQLGDRASTPVGPTADHIAEQAELGAPLA